MTTFVNMIEATGVYGRFDIHQEFQDGINIIYGKNGAGKTTLLHILANALSGEFERFRFLKFKSINVSLSDGRVLSITPKTRNEKSFIEARLDKEKIFQDAHQPDLLEAGINLPEEEKWKFINEKIAMDDISEQERRILIEGYLRSREKSRKIETIIPIAYFPAFRTMIEAWVAAATKKDAEPRRRYTPEYWKDLATERSRDWFGGFTPTVNFPSLVDIEEQLAEEIERARMNVWRTDQTLLSDVFLKIFASLSNTTKVDEKEETLLADIQSLFGQLEKSPLRSESRINFSELRDQINKLNVRDAAENTALRVLKIYEDILQRTLDVQKGSFEGIERYLSSVNEFLEGKSLVYKSDLPTRRRQSIQIRFDDGSFSNGLRTLSSGERQIMTLVYAATHMSQQRIVLIDEPEISLHVDWQRMLIKKMTEQMGNCQIIACTHSPVIGSDHMDKMKEISLCQTVSTAIIEDEKGDEEILF